MGHHMHKVTPTGRTSGGIKERAFGPCEGRACQDFKLTI